VPPSLLAMRIPGGLLYAPPPASALEPATPRASGRGCSLFPQEGCPLARYGREGQDKTANDFGVCVAGPVRPLVAVPIGPSLQHALKAPSCTQTNGRTPACNRPGDRYYRRTSERSSTVNVSRSVGKEWPHFSVGWSYYKLAMVHILECALSISVASKLSRLLGVNGNSNHACIPITAAYSGMARIARPDRHFLN
jgi:hypothetical protein